MTALDERGTTAAGTASPGGAVPRTVRTRSIRRLAVAVAIVKQRFSRQRPLGRMLLCLLLLLASAIIVMANLDVARTVVELRAQATTTTFRLAGPFETQLLAGSFLRLTGVCRGVVEGDGDRADVTLDDPGQPIEFAGRYDAKVSLQPLALPAGAVVTIAKATEHRIYDLILEAPGQDNAASSSVSAVATGTGDDCTSSIRFRIRIDEGVTASGLSSKLDPDAGVRRYEFTADRIAAITMPLADGTRLFEGAKIAGLDLRRELFFDGRRYAPSSIVGGKVVFRGYDDRQFELLPQEEIVIGIGDDAMAALRLVMPQEAYIGVDFAGEVQEFERGTDFTAYGLEAASYDSIMPTVLEFAWTRTWLQASIAILTLLISILTWLKWGES